jgi:hypothetical protein
MGRSDDQRAGMTEHYGNIRPAASLKYHILRARTQRDKPFVVVSMSRILWFDHSLKDFTNNWGNNWAKFEDNKDN